MEITINETEGFKSIALTGKLDARTVNDAQKTILPLAEEGHNLLIDMSGCDFVSSAGLRLLLLIAKAMTKEGKKGALFALSEEIQEVMEMTGFDHIFESYETKEEAEAYLKS